MSQSIKQFGDLHPKIYLATSNLRNNPKLRRGVMEAVVKLEDSTSHRDLADKVIKELERNAEHYFGAVKSAWNLRDSIQKSIDAFCGFIGKNELEVDYLWKRHEKSSSLKSKKSDNCVELPGISLGNSNDNYRVYVTDASVEVCIVPNISPSLFLDKGTNEKGRRITPRTLTFIKSGVGNKVLFLFEALTDQTQRRFFIDADKVRSLKFAPISTHFEQHYLNIRPRAVSGDEINVDRFGEHIGEKRPGKVQHVWIVDVTNRGQVGDIGPKGDKGDQGAPGGTFKGTSADTWAIKSLYDGKHPVLTLSEFEKAMRGELIRAAIPMSKSFFTFIERERNRKATLGTDYTEKTWIEETAHEQS